MRQICFRAGSKDGSTHTQWLLSWDFKDTGRHDKGVTPEGAGGTLLSGGGWEGMSHTAFRVACFTRYLEMTMTANRNPARAR